MREQILESFRRQGYAVLPDVLAPEAVAHARAELVAAADASERRGIPTRMEALDPGGRNIRVYDLIEYSPVFAQLVAHRAVIPYVDILLEGDLAISNFTASDV